MSECFRGDRRPVFHGAASEVKAGYSEESQMTLDTVVQATDFSLGENQTEGLYMCNNKVLHSLRIWGTEIMQFFFFLFSSNSRFVASTAFLLWIDCTLRDDSGGYPRGC